VVVGGTLYPTTPMDPGLSRLTARIPATAFPPGVPVAVTLLNPDGGMSLAVDITR
jgi:hypothetical protein